MSDWFSSLASQAMKIADDFADSLVAQASEAQDQIQKEQIKLKEEEEIRKQHLSTSTQLPWETNDESLQILSEDLMDLILKLSLNEQNFTVTPANSDEVHFVFSDFVATALHLLKLDSNLAHVHSKVSPKMDEEVFWRNYYCRVLYLRAKSGIDGAAAKNSSLKWGTNSAFPPIVFQPDYTSPSAVNNNSNAGATTPPLSLTKPGGGGKSSQQRASGSGSGNKEKGKSGGDSSANPSPSTNTSRGKTGGGEKSTTGTSLQLQDDGDIDDVQSLDLDDDEDEDEEQHSGSGKKRHQKHTTEEEEEEELDLADLDGDIDMDELLGELDLDDVDDAGEEGGDGDDTPGGPNSNGELGSYEEIGKSDCNSS